MRLLVWFLALAAVILGFWLLWGEQLELQFSLDGTIAYLESAQGYAWLAAWLLLLSDILAPIPGTVVMSALGWTYGVLVGGLLASVGSMLAGLAGYGLCRLLGEKAARFLLGDKDFERGHRWFDHGGGWLVCLTRALPVFAEVIACMAGLVRMSFRRFVVSLACGCLPLGFIFAWIGASGRDQPAMAMVLSMALPLGLWLIARLLIRKLEKREEEKDSSEISSKDD